MSNFLSEQPIDDILAYVSSMKYTGKIVKLSKLHIGQNVSYVIMGIRLSYKITSIGLMENYNGDLNVIYSGEPNCFPFNMLPCFRGYLDCVEINGLNVFSETDYEKVKKSTLLASLHCRHGKFKTIIETF